jgi:hypothetical protein
MAYTRTSQEWQTGANNLGQQISELENQRKELAAQSMALGDQRLELAATRQQLETSPNAATTTTVAQIEFLNSQINSLLQQGTQIRNQEFQLSDQISTLRVQQQGAENQASIATEGPPNTQVNPPPANAGSGNNTDPAPVQEPTVPTQLVSVNPASIVLTVPPGAEPDEGPRQGLLEPENIDEGRAAPAEGTRRGLDSPPFVNQELTVPLGADTEEEGRQPGLEEPPLNVTAGTIQARNTGLSNPAGGANQQAPAPLGGSNPVDWRFKIKLAPQAGVLYQVENPGLLKPIKDTQGVIFPYTPSVSINYNANYESTDVAHTNYKVYNYKNSAVESISVTGDFTAQDTAEANYLLAVIHFFRSATKMFYGKDEDPKLGLPPPLCYIEGHGQFLFSNHPVVIQNFNITYPNDVDYITATIDETGKDATGGVLNLPTYSSPSIGIPSVWQRLRQTGLSPGGRRAPRPASNFSQSTVTRVPTKIQISLTLLPMVTRADYSNKFSLRDYASGKLLAKGQGGFW